jgi:hypothetical protein
MRWGDATIYGPLCPAIAAGAPPKKNWKGVKGPGTPVSWVVPRSVLGEKKGKTEKRESQTTQERFLPARNVV